jgi:hypothetical protein
MEVLSSHIRRRQADIYTHCLSGVEAGDGMCDRWCESNHVIFHRNPSRKAMAAGISPPQHHRLYDLLRLANIIRT